MIDQQAMYVCVCWSLQVLPGSSGTLVLGVHHPEPTVRSLAVRQLGQSLRHKRQVAITLPVHV